MKRLLTIAGSDSSGGAGLQADLKTFHQLGGYGMSVVTAITAQNTVGIQQVEILSESLVSQQLTSVLKDIGVDAVKTGMLGSPENIRAIVSILQEFSPRVLVVDPILTATKGTALLQDGGLQAFIDELMPLATLITPNLEEAEAISGIPVTNMDEMKVAAQVIHGMSARHVLIKGGHLPGDAIDILFDGHDYVEFVAPRIAGKHWHGTGCTYSAAIAAFLALEQSLPEAVESAKRYLTHAFCNIKFGSGMNLLNHFSPSS